MATLLNKPLEISLKLAGFWPFKFDFVGPFILFSAALTMIPCQCWGAMYLIDDPLIMMQSFSDISTEILIVFKYLFMWMNKREIKNIIRIMIQSWQKDDIPDKLKVLARYCRIFCIVDISFYVSVVLPYYAEFTTKYMNSSANEVLLLGGHYPYNYTNSPYYEITSAAQLFQGASTGVADSLSKTFLVACVLQVAAQIILLEDQVEKYSVISSDDDKTSVKNLKLIIKEHLKIINFVEKINIVYRYASLFQIIFAGLSICVTGFAIITALESANILLLVKSIVYIILLLTQSFTFCYVGQYLRDKGESLIHTIYNTFWYDKQPYEIKMVMFVLFKAQKPLILHGGNVLELTLGSFLQILKTAYSYLSLLQVMYSK